MAQRLLELDPGLARRLDRDPDRALAKLVVPVVELRVGQWEPPRGEAAPGTLGLLLVQGLLIREVRVVDSWSAELLNPGDLLRPWLEDAASFVEAEWHVAEAAKIAVLEPRLTRRLAEWPVLIEELIDRGLRRSRSMAVHAAIAARRRVEDRLLLLFWHLAERRGQTQADGVRLDLPLTHSTLAHAIGAQRPTVTTALSRLAESNQVVRDVGDAWLLRGRAPEPPSAAAEPRP